MTRVAEKLVDEKWTWFQDYGYLGATWTLNCEKGRKCQVGMGVKAFGAPRGEKKTFTEHVEIITIGIGAIHVRTKDGKGPCLVRLDQGRAGLIPIVRDVTFP